MSNVGPQRNIVADTFTGGRSQLKNELAVPLNARLITTNETNKRTDRRKPASPRLKTKESQGKKANTERKETF